MSEDLSGRTAVVTGASSGIGRATAGALSEAGAAVSLAARSEGRIAELADDLETAAIVVPTESGRKTRSRR